MAGILKVLFEIHRNSNVVGAIGLKKRHVLYVKSYQSMWNELLIFKGMWFMLMVYKNQELKETLSC